MALTNAEKWKRGLAVIIAVAALLLLAVVTFSPYYRHDDDNFRSLKQTITINASPAVVYSYLGNSSNAAEWSVYVDHIVTLNADKVPDGMPGSIRRCFKQADEKGVIWDELITIADRDTRRQLTIFNMRGFPLQANGLLTEQEYEPVDNGKTKLTFTVFYGKRPGIFTTFKTHLAAYSISDIFKQNLQNIKMYIEQRGRANNELQKKEP